MFSTKLDKGDHLNREISIAPIAGVFEPLLTADEAAEHLRIHVKTLQRLAREGRVPSVRMGKYWRFRLSSLDRWVTTIQNEVSQPVCV